MQNTVLEGDKQSEITDMEAGPKESKFKDSPQKKNMMKTSEEKVRRRKKSSSSKSRKSHCDCQNRSNGGSTDHNTSSGSGRAFGFVIGGKSSE